MIRELILLVGNQSNIPLEEVDLNNLCVQVADLRDLCFNIRYLVFQLGDFVLHGHF
jgi:hypothetical protein